MADVQARRVVWTQPGVVQMETVRLREPGPGEVLVAAEVSLISPGTERAFLLNLENTAGAFPRTGGYSLIGHVAALGPGVSTVEVGQRVACPASHMSHAVVRAERCVPVPSELSSERASFFNLGAIALQGVRKAGVELGEAVVVFGAGLIGLLAMRLAQLSGGLPSLSLDPQPWRRQVAERFGADAALDPRSENLAEALAEALQGAPAGAPHVVIEATGFPEVIQQAFEVAGWMARVVLLGSSRGVTSQVNFYRDVHKKGLTLLGAHASTIPARDTAPGRWPWRQNVETVLRLIAADRLPVEQLITHRLPAEEAPAIYGEIAQWKPEVLGAILEWS